MTSRTNKQARDLATAYRNILDKALETSNPTVRRIMISLVFRFLEEADEATLWAMIGEQGHYYWDGAIAERLRKYKGYTTEEIEEALEEMAATPNA